jgi:tetrahydromethanopterin S-methyltransferase subunit H
VGENSKALTKYIEFAANITDSPLLINGPSASVRVEAANYVREVGLQNK